MNDKILGPDAPGAVSRRQFVVSALAAGFAAVVRPTSAQSPITTDTHGLAAGEIRIPVVDGEIPGYRAMPDHGGGFATILVVQEIFGVHEHIRDICRRLAKLGYLAVAPELYAREGDVSKMTDMQEIFSRVVARVPDAQVLSDLDATAGWAVKHGGDAKRLGITGFCWGGRITWLYAAHNPKLRAAVAWYGRLVGAADALHPKYPIDLVRDIKVPVLGLYGGADQSIPLETIEKMRAELKAAASASEIVIYPDVPHAFHADYRPSYRKEAAEDAWKRMQAWFRKWGLPQSGATGAPAAG
jgi:carboxymethylenebutenolidase